MELHIKTEQINRPEFYTEGYLLDDNPVKEPLRIYKRKNLVYGRCPCCKESFLLEEENE